MSVRDDLVEAGVRLLERDGLAALSLRTIARTAGVSHGAPRNHFPTYGSLLAAIARSGLEDLDTALGPALRDHEPDRGVRTAAEAYVDFALRRPEMFALISRHDMLAGQGGELRKITAGWFRDLHAALARATGRSVSGEEALALWSGVHGLAALTSRRTTEAVGDLDPHRALEVVLARALA